MLIIKHFKSQTGKIFMLLKERNGEGEEKSIYMLHIQATRLRDVNGKFCE